MSSTFHPTRVASQPTRYIRTRLSIRPARKSLYVRGPAALAVSRTRSPASVRGYYSSSFLCSPRDPWNRDRVWRLVHISLRHIFCVSSVCVRATCTTLWLPLRVPWPQHGARAPRGFAFPFPYQPSAILHARQSCSIVRRAVRRTAHIRDLFVCVLLSTAMVSCTCFTQWFGTWYGIG